jgi:hypothetical protein
MAFGMDFPELVLILIIVLVVFGTTSLAQRNGGESQIADRPAGAWTRGDWALVIATVALALLAAALVTRRHG